MKTFAEVKEKEVFDWNAFLSKTIFTEEELQKAYDLACDWVTCACGVQCNSIPRDPETNTPLDSQLIQFGSAFATFIALLQSQSEIDKSVKNCEEAKSILRLIEKRSAYLILNM